eukprot:TRINITY_DN8070_c0_g3_i1.p1 TRINITY_DN8070_c0_g3~~TRINITY_DN8070_c0_g3_i1.p1  ORF type:complete len:477 (-),score=79.02 TRINITY_DN8070_c0_g3_i1:134-1564(-)
MESLIVRSHVCALIFNRKDFELYCLPNFEGVKEFFLAAGMKMVGEYILDLYNGWKVLVAAAVFGFVFSLFYMIFLKCCARVLIWVTVLAAIVLLAVLGFLFFWNYRNEADEDFKLLYKVLAIVFWSLSGIVALVLLCLYGDIQMSLSVVESAASFMFTNCGVIFIPIVINILTACFVLYWIAALVYFLSTGEISQWGSTPFATVSFTDALFRNSFIYQLFALFWVWAFFIGLNQFVLSATVIQWYFTANSDTKGNISIAKSFCWALFYHIGSLAFGSIFLAIIMFIRFVFEYMRRKVMKAERHNALMRCLLSCFSCCLKCIGECILFLTKNAYVQVAIRSTCFCCAAKEAFRLIIRNATRFALVNAFSGVFVFFGKCAVGAGTAFFCWMLLNSWSEVRDNVYAPSVMTIVCFAIGYLVAVLLLTVYDIASNTILQCFLIDEETSGHGGRNRPRCLDNFMTEVRNSFIAVDKRERLS